ncbi:hypothetical protein SERLA73DRAFT_76519 [Serpula lacrymans var. lacrymans S7.3]|uniref:Uncharacterized protein n=2 Tax=Serpula lacrymans var. lacrymans TaxID=341189 RepID=F8Q773_SERL3|nr:uncharacterized protein SERLADRAFT_441333 [Serpula lacrymans var. lacrymans S7.9]EGN95411.1 hypothetical protein SERLA73DRAFT_76519 [Serpula lacrymans var. lacrymans S7.3]EGO20944.1 hypothetical protein SERLADRAFT_441333 [Serpula lacrymans var. lacrymans S7.9]
MDSPIARVIESQRHAYSTDFPPPYLLLQDTPFSKNSRIHDPSVFFTYRASASPLLSHLFEHTRGLDSGDLFVKLISQKADQSYDLPSVRYRHQQQKLIFTRHPHSYDDVDIYRLDIPLQNYAQHALSGS